jgi:putative two-component system response regulator
VSKILTDRLADLGQKTSADIIDAYQTVMFVLADLADSRDPETGEHLERTRRYCALLASILSRHELYKRKIDPVFIECIFQVSPLHDIGKVAVPDAILLKPGKLTGEEFEVMKTHTTAGARALEKVVERCDQPIFHMAYDICLHHHERWDGKGYPTGLAGENIPMGARIMAIADVYDAVLSKRVYKASMSYEEASAIIRESSGKGFDPVIANIMLGNIERFEEIHREFG